MGKARLIFIDRQRADGPAMGLADQMLSVLAIVDRLLTDSGALRSHILSVRIDLTDAGDYMEVMRLWSAWAVAGRVAPRATVGLMAERNGFLVEASVVAAFTPHRMRPS